MSEPIRHSPRLRALIWGEVTLITDPGTDHAETSIERGETLLFQADTPEALLAKIHQSLIDPNRRALPDPQSTFRNPQ